MLREARKVEEALRPILEFRRYKVYDNSAVREFYSILRSAIKGAMAIGQVDLLINDLKVPKIMGKMPFADWKEWATRRPKWSREDKSAAFQMCVELKWLNIAAAEPHGWEAGGDRTESGQVERSS